MVCVSTCGVETDVHVNYSYIFIPSFQSVIPEITFPSPDTTLIVNETFSTVIQCSATGIPAPDIQWFRGAMELTGVGSVLNNSQATNDRIVLSEPSIGRLSTPNGTIYQTDSTLTLNNAMGNDTGDYYCVASNGNTGQPTDSRDFDIFVQSMWSFLSRCITCG